MKAPRATKEPLSGMSFHSMKRNISFHFNSEINKHVKSKGQELLMCVSLPQDPKELRSATYCYSPLGCVSHYHLEKSEEHHFREAIPYDA